MKYSTISELVAEHLEGCLVNSAFFSSFSFEADFFELEIIPLLMAQQDAKSGKVYHAELSTNDAIRWQQLERLMAERMIDTSVVYEPNIYLCERSPRLEIAYHAYAPSNGCQHAKLIAMQLKKPVPEDEEGNATSSVLFGAGSFNLTRAGWWDNIECGHFVTLSAQWAPKNLCRDILAALNFYLAKVGGKDQALKNVINTIEQLPKTADDLDLKFYFSDGKNPPFNEFIKENKVPTDQLEVISPYFAESGDNKVITGFINSFKKTKVLLLFDPRDSSKAKVDKSVYKTLKTNGVQWCGWESAVKTSLEKDCNQRELHAKVYRMSSEKHCALFIGSVNFSYKAFRDNIEVGFLIKKLNTSRLLSDKVVAEPDDFEVVNDEIHGGSAEVSGCLPVLNIVYCWKAKALLLLVEGIGWPNNITLKNSADEQLAVIKSIEGKLGSHIEITSIHQLEKHLENSSLMIATSDVEGESRSTELLVSQINICIRPSTLPPLRLADLLSIFRGMSKPQLLMLTEQYAKLSELQLAYQSGDDFGAELKAASRNFFSEFSEINSAFYHLNDRLTLAKEEGQQRTLDYYLNGKQADSLYGLFLALCPIDDKTNSQEQIEPTARYLTLLSIKDTLMKISNDNQTLKGSVDTAINDLESKGELKLSEDNDPKYHLQFIEWFKAEFFACDKGGKS